MRTDRQLTFSFSILIGIGVSIALAAITLFGRMAPAIEGIIEDNVVSIEAAEAMLAGMVDAELGGDPAGARRAFDGAFATARRNVTEPDEGLILDRIERLAPAAFDGDPDSVRQLVLEIRALGDVNRGAMTTADQSAKRLGVAGAWTMVVLGAGGFVVGLFTQRRLRKRVLLPLQEIHATLRSITMGDRLRRCTSPTAPCSDLSEIMAMINRLLDRQLEKDTSTLRESIAEAPPEEPASRASLPPPSR